MQATHSGLSEVARLLGQRPPFDALSLTEIGKLIADTEIGFHRTGTPIFSNDDASALHAIHSGAVDLAHDGVVDRLGPGDTFGHGAGLALGFHATAAQDTLCYRIPAAARTMLDRGRTRSAGGATAKVESVSGGPVTSARGSRRSSLGTAWREARWCAIDLELTGLDPRNDHIVAMGAVPIEHGRVMLGKVLYSLVRTSRPSERDALLAHKLRPEDLEDAPTIDEAFELLLGALSGHHPVFHTAAIERSFLGPLFARRRARLPDAADTEVLGRLWLLRPGDPAPAGLPLTRLARTLGQRTEEPHHALADALMTALVFIALAEHLDAFEPQTVGRLVRAEDRFRGARRFAPG
jgi:DNA polymerase III subunit epsilon